MRVDVYKRQTVYRNVNNNTTDLTQKIGALCIFIDRKMFQERIDDLMMEEEQHYVDVYKRQM